MSGTSFLPIESVLHELPKYEIRDKLAYRVRNGQVLPIPKQIVHIDGPIAVYYKGKIIAIYKNIQRKME